MQSRKLRLVLECAILINALSRLLEIIHALLNMAINYCDKKNELKMALKI